MLISLSLFNFTHSHVSLDVVDTYKFLLFYQVEIEYSGNGDIVEVAGSFNGWHHPIKMDPHSLATATDTIGSRSSICSSDLVYVNDQLIGLSIPFWLPFFFFSIDCDAWNMLFHIGFVLSRLSSKLHFSYRQ